MNNMSLKSKLNNLIQSRNGGIVTINEVNKLCEQEHYKYSNAERRLRRSESPNVVPVFKGNAIVGYKWGLGAKKEGCCVSVIIYGTHSRDCAALTKVTPATQLTMNI